MLTKEDLIEWKSYPDEVEWFGNAFPDGCIASEAVSRLISGNEIHLAIWVLGHVLDRKRNIQHAMRSDEIALKVYERGCHYDDQGIKWIRKVIYGDNEDRSDMDVSYASMYAANFAKYVDKDLQRQVVDYGLELLKQQEREES
jgi:hypothetical protein